MKNLLFSLIPLILFMYSCDSKSDKQQKGADQALNSEAILQEGKQLSEKYCGNCHQYPKPDLLDKSTWRASVLPRMGYLMGIYDEDREKALAGVLEEGLGRQIVEAANIFPKQALLPVEDWQKIKSYYLNTAPESLENTAFKAPQDTLLGFTVKKPAYALSPPSTTLIHINDDQTFFIGDANKESLFLFDSNLNLKNAAKVNEGAVSLTSNPERFNVTVMGSFSPTDQALGFVMALPKNTGQKPKVLVNRLQRPVHTDFGDLNQDGQEDMVICEFAKWTGGLSWWENQQGNYTRHILRSKPGAVKSLVRDFNQDGKPDVVALFGQGDEGIFLYTNQGGGKFLEKRLLEFPSSYGSSYFDLFDFNQDGHLDIIYTAGDNADYTPIVKPYHGLYIFLNDGQNQFRQDFFYPFPGAYKAIPQDFDEDGDIDFALISFFPDYQKEKPVGFVYLENSGEDKFQAQTFPEVTAGRWITMDAGDIDGDKDIDLILGSLAFEVIPRNGLLEQWVQQGLPFIVLENKAK